VLHCMRETHARRRDVFIQTQGRIPGDDQHDEGQASEHAFATPTHQHHPAAGAATR
jgi:hypothetical protein